MIDDGQKRLRVRNSLMCVASMHMHAYQNSNFNSVVTAIHIDQIKKWNCKPLVNLSSGTCSKTYLLDIKLLLIILILISSIHLSPFSNMSNWLWSATKTLTHDSNCLFIPCQIFNLVVMKLNEKFKHIIYLFVLEHNE